MPGTFPWSNPGHGCNESVPLLHDEPRCRLLDSKVGSVGGRVYFSLLVFMMAITSSLAVRAMTANVEIPPNENKISDGYRERALIEVEAF